jgi:hypothetical protein
VFEGGGEVRAGGHSVAAAAEPAGDLVDVHGRGTGPPVIGATAERAADAAVLQFDS